MKAIERMNASELKMYIEYLEKKIAAHDIKKAVYDEFMDKCHDLGFDAE